MLNLIIFDLDSTLAESKMAITLEMAELLEKLLDKYQVAVISGGAYKQYKTQFLSMLPLHDKTLEKLSLFPTSGTSFYRYQNKEWKLIYAELLTQDQKKSIYDAFEKCFEEIGFVVPHYPEYGEILEDRGCQITFSALGQQAPLHLKKYWDPSLKKRLRMIDILKQYLSGLEIRAGGSTSIDITIANIDKSYCVGPIKNYLGFNVDECIFIGDQLTFGNDAPMKKTGMKCIETSGPAETMKIINDILNGNI